ncbi:helix-turn-helix domain-containing protein [Streptomyces sp. CA-253872]|uniref:helix-turn-helix domain-containing protein n=1 Tax=Streptomyces sp. CA-253872 TaxID=3240067 RepID=UPI003D8BA57C
MSHQAVTWAMDDAPMLRTTKGRPDTTARGVLQALAEHADAYGRNAHPSVAKLSYRTGYDRRTVQRALRHLGEGGLIRATGRQYERTVYALALHLKRPASDWTDLLAEEEHSKAQARERQRKARAKRAAAETAAAETAAAETAAAETAAAETAAAETAAAETAEVEVAGAETAEGVPVTHSDDVTEDGPEGDVTHSDDERHAVEERDVTQSECARHALSAAVTVPNPPEQPPTNPLDGRRPTTGSGERAPSGYAAQTTSGPEVEDEDEVPAAAIGMVVSLLPLTLRDQLPSPVPKTLTNAIRAELARGLTSEDLVRRVQRRWWDHGYEATSESLDGPGILRPVGVAVALVRRGNCPSPRCDDGLDLDTLGACRTCEREAEDRRQRQEAAEQPQQGTILMAVPNAPAEPAPAPLPRLPAPPRLSSGRTEVRQCEGSCDRVFRTVPAPAPAGMCRDCRAEADRRTVTA